ncbi:hypothetical protein [Sphingomonas sp. M1-B02]|uniref:hypothetical protein n=1 Tax=Sphingomonas sp. M1-B02 TaxID=3114300 RepID=UPI00223EECFD|nr:hypothetical protein [Sphingomonas sp. S6-11]UZK65463.1 hypothetical protein OKW87_13230 [Sphingomonas sp. S6-11]
MISSRTALLALATGASLLALATPAAAQTILFSTGTTDAGAAPTGPLSGPLAVRGGITQLRTDDGGLLSFVGDSTFEVEGSTVKIAMGKFTARAGRNALRIVAPDGTTATLGAGNAASFGVTNGGLTGRALSGQVSIASGSESRRFGVGDAFAADAQDVSAVVTAGVQPSSAATVVAAAPSFALESENPLLPIYREANRADVLAQALALRDTAIGVNFESVSRATADVNLAFLRAGGTAGGFSPALAGSTLQQYLSALRSGATPAGATLANAYLGYFSADGLTGLAAQQRAIIEAYTRILAAGGSSGSFNDATIGTAYSDYVRQLAAGAANGGLSPAVLAAYENYVRSLGFGETFDAGRRAQIEAFQRLQAAGGSASAAAGVEVVDRYLAFLASGGIAANYTGASTNLIAIYLDYLRSVGFPQGTDPDAVARLLAFYAHIAAGGSIATSPTTTPPVVTPPVVTPPVVTPPTTTPATYAGAFSGRAGTTSFGGDAGAVAVEIDAAGYPRSFYGNQRVGTARLAESANGEGWVIGRYTDGTLSRTAQGTSTEVTLSPNESLHFALGTSYVPFTGNRGSARYQIAGFTTPTYADGAAVTAASLTGSMLVQFGSQLKYGVEGSLTTMAAGQAQRYDFVSAGGLTAPSLTGSVTANGFYLFGQAPVTTKDARCTAGCRFAPNMFGSGADGQVIAGTYSLLATNAVLTGGAVFTQTSRDTAVAPVTPVTPPVTPVATGAPTGFVEFAGIGAFTELNGTSVQTQSVAASDGKLESIRANGRGTNVDREYGGLAGAIGWTRWSGGTTQAQVVGRGTATIAENGGQHMVWGKQVTNLPTSGTASYTLAGATKPTDNNGSVAPGTLASGSLAVDFATMRVGYDLSVQFGGATYGFQSRGGSAAPSLAVTSGGRFTSSFRDSEGPLVTGNGCSGTNCFAETFGFLAGSGASHAGLTYHFLSGPSGSIVNGAAVFAKGP